MSMQVKNAVRIYGAMRTALKSNHQGMAEAKLDDTALALTQSALLAEAIGSLGVSDIGPAIEGAAREISDVAKAIGDAVGDVGPAIEAAGRDIASSIPS